MSIALDVVEDEYRIQALERQHLKIVVNNRYIACEDMNLIWDMKEVQRFEEAWRAGYAIDMIADAMGRDVDEVAILAMDRVRKRKIGKRTGGVWGSQKPDEADKISHKLNPDQKDAIVRVLELDVPVALLGEALGLSYQALGHIRRQAKQKARDKASEAADSM